MEKENDIAGSAQIAALKLEGRLGYKFKDRALLKTALTHRSYRFEAGLDSDNQRLEFLGDALLGFLLADRVYMGPAQRPEGILTVLRSSVASGVALAAKARELDVGSALLLGRGEANTGGRDRESNLSDTVEALLGAIYIDGGMGAASDVFDRMFAEELSGLEEDPWADNPKGRLQSEAQRRFHVEPVYEVLEESGPRHCSKFRVRVSVGDGLHAEGVGDTKRQAQTFAAAALLAEMDKDAE